MTEQLMEDYTKLIHIIDWNLSEKAISSFKIEKIENFSKILREMSQVEVENSNVGASYWSKVLSNNNLKHF